MVHYNIIPILSNLEWNYSKNCLINIIFIKIIGQKINRQRPIILKILENATFIKTWYSRFSRFLNEDGMWNENPVLEC